MRERYDHEYPPGEWTVDGIAASLADTEERYPIPTYEEREAWEAIRTSPATGGLAEQVLTRAASARREPMPDLPATLYLDYARTGNRVRYQNPERERRRRLSYFALAECLEREEEYLDNVLDYAWAICEQAAWVWPAHIGGEHDVEGLPGVVPDEERTVALFSVGMALLLAELDYVLGERLHPALRERIRHEVDRRVLTPYQAHEEHRWIGPPANNWNAVCNAGTAIAALYLLEDPDRQARIVEQAARTMRHYVNDFDSDGCTAEGVGYWNYDFGNYVALAAHLEARTDGEYSLLSPPIVERIAEYPLKVELSPGHFVPFSDTEEETTVAPRIACWLGERLDLPGLAARGRRQLESPELLFPGSGGRNLYMLPEIVRDLAWSRTVPAEWSVPTPEPRQFLSGCDWWLARADPGDPEGLVVAAKGGHNAESHNHNDLGSFVVHARGESLLTDLGRPSYDRDFFGARRYLDYLTPRSLGHSVPYVNGHEQRAGEEYAAELLGREEGDTESIAFDLAGAYPEEADLDALERTVSLDRGDGGVTVADDVQFGGGPGEFESVLVSYFPMEAADGAIEVRGDRGRATVRPDRDADLSVERLADAVDMSWRDDSDHWDVWRARVAPDPAEALSLTLEIEVDIVVPACAREDIGD